MKIAYITYWPYDDVLSKGSSHVNLKELARVEEVSKIDYYTIERNHQNNFIHKNSFNFKVKHYPVYPKISNFKILIKTSEYINLYRKLRENHLKEKYDLVICRSSFSGSVGLIFKKLFGVKFSVESYEPHSSYMNSIPNGWRKIGIKFALLNLFEYLECKYADVIMPLTNNGLNKLSEKFPKTKFIQQPCGSSFERRFENRANIRERYGIEKSKIIGVYVGKFGGLYYDKEALAFLRELILQDKMRKIHIILLTNSNITKDIEKFSITNFPMDRVNADFIGQDEVHDLLSQCDFAINFHRENAYSEFLSPIKNAEYWAAGLPILLPNSIGDDSSLVKINKLLGYIYDISNCNEHSILYVLNYLYSIENRKLDIKDIAFKYRDVSCIKKSYMDLIKHIK